MRKELIISGASGLIGTSLLELLKENKKYQIIGIYNNNRPVISSKNILYIKGELTQQKTWDSIKDINIHAFIHCAARIPKSFSGNDARESYLTNLEMDRSTISFVKEKKAKLIYTSSSSVYGIITNIVCNEKSKPNPTNEYSRGKLESENKISSDKNIEKYFILRISAPYGPYQQKITVLSTFIKNALRGTPLYYYGSGGRTQDFIYVKDVARAYVAAIESNNFGIYNIASGNSISMIDLAFLVKKLVNNNAEIKSKDREDPEELYRPVFDISKAKTLLNWHPIYSLEAGLKKFIDYIKNSES